MNDATELLSRWQRKRLDTLHAGRRDYGRGPDSVTVLAYYWGAGTDSPDTSFYRIEAAFRETWLHCGMMKSVIVTDFATKEVDLFAKQFPCIEIQEEQRLVPGDLLSMSRDCDGRLADRFSTDYLMIIQDDGFPLRRGIESFLGKWDFIGPPYVRDKFFPRLIARMFNLWTANGGFSIRSKRMCDLAQKYWQEKYHAFPDCHAIGEDAYYTETLLRRHRDYRCTMKMADNRSAIQFGYDCIVEQPVKSLPFGFHRAETFAEFNRRGWIQE